MRDHRPADEEFKAADDALRHLRQMVEGWENRLTLAEPRFAKRYVEDKLCIHVHLRAIGGHGWRNSDTVGEHYCS